MSHSILGAGVGADTGIGAGVGDSAMSPGPMRFSWRCENFASLREEKRYSPVYSFGPFQWRLLIFPRGLRTNRDFSVFVDVADADTLPPRFRREAQFTLEVVNQKDPACTIRKNAAHAFCLMERDRGFTEMTDGRRDEILNPAAGFLDEEGALELRCTVDVHYDGVDEDDSDTEEERVDWRYDSKSATGFVGLANQGATCYLNSLLQALYHLPAFKALVYSLSDAGAEAPTSTHTPPGPTVVHALQCLFWRLEESPRAVETLELTRAFGWTSADAFVQHDVQELLRVLFDRLEARSAQAKTRLAELFRGQLENRIACVNVPYETARNEDFYDVSLNVKGSPTLELALTKFCEEELLCGADQYRAPEPHGLQDARKGIRFLTLPPVLHLHLKRFELDLYGDGYVKVNDRQSYPLELDLGPHLATSALRTPAPKYHLHGVLVHRGAVQSGHYYAFLRPRLDKQWYKFDDSTVVKVSERRALQDNFGGITQRHPATAYMLIYVREAEREALFAPTTLPPELRARLAEDELRERTARAEREEARAHTEVALIDEALLLAHRGADLCAPSATRRVKVRKDESVQSLLTKLSADLESEDVRVWDWVRRTNKSQRPDVPLSKSQLSAPVNSLHKTDGVVFLWLESPPHIVLRKSEALLFVKWYDAATRELRYIGRLALPSSAQLRAVAEFARKKLNLDKDTKLLLWEEVSAKRVDLLKAESTLEEAELGTGDIIVCQLAPPAQPQSPSPEETASELATPKDYIRYLRKRRTVKVLALDAAPGSEGHQIEARTDRSLAHLAATLGAVLDIKAQRVLFTGALVDETTTPPSMRPRTVPHHYAHGETLKRAAEVARCAQDVLFYEVLPETVTRDKLRDESVVRVRVHIREHAHDTLAQMRALTFYGARDETLHSLLAPTALDGDVHLLAVREGRVWSRYTLTQRCEELDTNALSNPDTHWLVERAPILTEGAIALACAHARPPTPTSITVKCWGLPFYVSLAPTDSVAELVERVRSALGVNKGEFTTWKIARFDPRLDTLDKVTPVEAALAQSGAGSAWSLWGAAPGAHLALLHHAPERDPHARSVKIQ